jgi:uncharacterized protein
VPRGRHNSLLRKAGIAAVDALLFGGFAARCSYRLGWHGQLRVTRHGLQLAQAKRLVTPLVVAFASDFHAGRATHPEIFSALMDEVARQKPDVLLLGGDFVFGKAKYMNQLTGLLSKYRAPLGTFAVLGNHDLWTDDVFIAAQLREIGVEVLINRNTPLPPPFDMVSICGLDDPWTGEADLKQALEGARPVRILLSHSPDGLLKLDQEQFDVCLSGHTHGGQIALPNGKSIVNAGGPLSSIYTRGIFPMQGNGPLIVSRGIGCSSIPVRINSDPELVVCTLC